MNQFNLSDIRVFKKNSVYRIGDLLLHSGPRWHIDRREVVFNEKYKNTLLYKYFHHFKVDQHTWNHSSLELINKLSTYDKENTFIDFKFITDQHRVSVSKSDLLVHVRCGDIVSPRCISYTHCHLLNQSKLIDLINKNIHSGIKNIVIISAMHYGADSLRSKRYFWTQKKHDTNLKLLNKLFVNISNSFGLPIVIDSESSSDLEFIDNQFLKLVYADNVVLDGGGFSKIIQKLRSLNTQP